MMRVTVNANPMGTRRATTRDTGQVLVLFALFLVVFLGFTAVTIDYGSWLKARRDYQNAADSAALAGSAFLSRPIDNTKRRQAREAAWESLKQQLGLSLDPSNPSLWTNSTPADLWVNDSGYRLWVSTPPIDATTKYPGGYTGPTDRYLFVWVEKENPSFFARIFGQGDATVGAWATAGSFPSRFAVITLRQPGQDGPANAKDIDLAGTGSKLEVIDGDVGGNWGMKLNSASQLWLRGISDNEADVYLQTYTTCGESCWSPNQINSGPNGNPPNVMKTPLEIPYILEDPNYPLPSVLAGLPVTGGTAAVPQAGGTKNAPPSKVGDLTLTKGTRSGVGCDADSPRIGPGWYHDLRINECAVLDPVHNYSDPDDSNNDGDFGQTDVPASQQPGIFYITGNLDVQAGALLVGDGVTIVLRPPGASLQPSGSGAVIDLNTGASDGVAGGPPNQKKAAFMTDGNYTYGYDSGLGRWVYNSSLNSDNTRTGVAIYVAKPSQYGVSASDANTDVIKVNALAGLAWSGVTYAPHDNIEIAGQPDHDGIGQFVSWTFKFAGNTVVKQLYDGPDQSIPRLVEPHLGQ